MLDRGVSQGGRGCGVGPAPISTMSGVPECSLHHGSIRRVRGPRRPMLPALWGGRAWPRAVLCVAAALLGVGAVRGCTNPARTSSWPIREHQAQPQVAPCPGTAVSARQDCPLPCPVWTSSVRCVRLGPSA